MIQATSPRKPKEQLQSYLENLGRFPLLTHEQEINLGRQVMKLMEVSAIKERLAQELEREPDLAEWADRVQLSPEELEAIVKHGERAKSKFVNSNLRLVVSIAKKYQHRGLELPDLIQEGSLGLIRAVEKYDPDSGFRFSTYAYWWIYQAVTRAIAISSRTIRLPVHLHEKLNKVKKVTRELTQKHGKFPSLIEIATETKIPEKVLKPILERAKPVISLDLKVGQDADVSLGELLEVDGITPDQYVLNETMREHLHQLLASLPPRTQEVMRLRYGLCDGKVLSLAEIGNRLKITRERVRQIERQAISKLKAHRQHLVFEN